MSSPQVLETVERLGEAVRTELTTLEEVLSERVELVAATRGARRQAEAVAQHLQGLAFWQGVSLSPVQVAEDVTFVEEYRWEKKLSGFFFFKHCSLTLVPGGIWGSIWRQFYLPHWLEVKLLSPDGSRDAGQHPPGQPHCGELPSCEYKSRLTN